MFAVRLINQSWDPRHFVGQASGPAVPVLWVIVFRFHTMPTFEELANEPIH